MKFITRGQKSTLASLGVEGFTPTVSLSVALELSGGPEIDVCCFGLDEQGRLSDERYFVFYNQPQSPCGAVSAKGGSVGARQVFQIDFSKLPTTIKRLVFSATVDGLAAMRQITRGLVQVSAAGAPIAEFQLQGSDYADEKALMLAELYWKDGWRLAATGQGFSAGLPGLIKHFGGEVEEKRPVPPLTNVPPPLPDASPQPLTGGAKGILQKITLTKPGQSHSLTLEKGASAPRKMIVRATWVDNGDDSDDNDDLDLRVGILLADGRMRFICAPDRVGNFDIEPFIRHTGDVISASLMEPATETVEVNPAIAQSCGGKVALVFSVYSAVSNGAVSVASLRPTMRMEYGQQIVECAFDFTKTKAAFDDSVYTYVIGIAIIDKNSIRLEPSGMTSSPGSESTPWLEWNGSKGVKLSMNGPVVFKGADASAENHGNYRRYI